MCIRKVPRGFPSVPGMCGYSWRGKGRDGYTAPPHPPTIPFTNDGNLSFEMRCENKEGVWTERKEEGIADEGQKEEIGVGENNGRSM